jgi:hypothetical protein
MNLAYRMHGVVFGVTPTEPTVEDIPKVTFLQSFGCCGSFKTPKVGFNIFAGPVDWLPDTLKTKVKLDQLTEALNGLGVTFDFLGRHSPANLNLIRNHLNRTLMTCVKSGATPQRDDILFKPDWAIFVLKNVKNALHQYYGMCLMRHLFSKQYNKLFEDMLTLKKVTKFSFFECFQIAHYANPNPYDGGTGFFPTAYGGLKFLTLEELEKHLATNQSLNPVFTTKIIQPYQNIHQLYKEQKYEQIKQTLR